ncbi:MAG: outer membrane lipoprotein-sorting protein [candidate division KSB1 bacterium]|nr:outer membrane lipoprotein-sorting protein [candidate division KSB1 bacterium]
MRCRWLVLVALMGGVALCPLFPEDRGNEILAKVQATANAPRDRSATMAMELVDKGGNTKHRLVQMYQKGDQKRLIRFLEPADVKGVGFLVLSQDEMWLYMPAFHKIRRIASHTKHEKFMGTDFTYDDLAETKYSEHYQATLVHEDEAIAVLTLIPKPEAEVNYGRLVMTVDKSNWVPQRVEFYDRTGTLRKVLTNGKVEKIGPYWTVTQMTMEDVQDKHKTVLSLREIKHDVGLDDEVFSKRSLMRGQ